MVAALVRPALRVAGILLLILAGVMLLPALVDAGLGNREWVGFIVSAFIVGFTGLLLTVSFSPSGRLTLTVKQAFFVTASSWIILSIFASIPFLLGDPRLTLADAVFETVSGLTTTGSTVLAGLEELPRGILLWRALLQWVGGVGIILVASIVLPLLRVGGMQLFHTESSDRSGKAVPRAAQLVSMISFIYLMLTLACILVYAALGMSWFDATCHAMTTLSTGGFANYDQSFGAYDNPGILWAGSVFMMCGAIPFVTYVGLLGRRSGALDEQIGGFLLVILFASVTMTVYVMEASGLPFGTAATHAVFNVVSIVTTTGFASTDYLVWGAFAGTAFFALTFIGGCTGSTSGAIKIFRFQVLTKVVFHYLQRLTTPHRIIHMRFNGRPLPEDVPFAVLAFVAAYLGAIVVLTICLAATGLDFTTSVSGAATALGNVGPGIGAVIGPAGNYATLPDAAKWFLSAGMLLGRLELFTLLVVILPSFWTE